MAFANGQIAQCPPHPITLREEHIAPAETTIVIQQYSNRWYSKFTVRTTSGTLLFTADPKSLRVQCRARVCRRVGPPAFRAPFATAEPQSMVRHVAGRGWTTLLSGEMNVMLRNLAPALFGPTEDEATLQV
ncbi:hypothetical protein MPDQ_005599 [Monascus purpureus]|uniref:Uncharacterized protein n=1 Tax=Monascus purpureus TaxID=5098 RepID=A0A507R061_MONPU|nr:hypothetical protein MPDQ_005599 [Monascus purpureus]BDD56240.1 hypothetical protein MAP00_001714 [Monascus purpureus]